MSRVKLIKGLKHLWNLNYINKIKIVLHFSTNGIFKEVSFSSTLYQTREC